ncbi:hypothetical protein WJX73_001434 [Symbiochloris irregularis]|uniref:Importin subunit alpha n=1 Tax=Symbiochloris irregularis TaxID=706552 RepID=A0AAW1PYL5_9CHLO
MSSGSGPNRADLRAKSNIHARAAAQQRKKESSEIAKLRRDTLLAAKRVKRTSGNDQISPVPGTSHLLETSPPSADELQAISDRLLQSTAAASPERASHLKALRILICRGDPLLVPNLQLADDQERHSVCWHLQQLQVVPALIQALNPKSHDHDCILEAAWCLTNMAAAEHEVAQAVMGAAPLFIALLGGGWGAPIAGLCAWALGNLAGDCKEFSATLVANGAVLPLLSVVLKGRQPSESPAADLDAAETAVWALSSLAKHSSKAVAELLAAPGSLTGMGRLLQQASEGLHPGPSLSIELAWLLTALLRSVDAVSTAVVGVLQPLLTLLQAAAIAEEPSPQQRAFLIPGIRCLGAVAALGTLQQEAAWVVSSLACHYSRHSSRAWQGSEALAALASVLSHGPLLGRRWAATALLNISASGPQGLEAVVGHPAAATGLISLLSSRQLAWAVRMGMQFMELMLRLLPAGADMLTQLGAWDALQVHQFRSEQQLAGMASCLLKQRC